MTARYISTTETAKLIRQALKAEFPGVKFSVCSNKYAGGSSIDVSYEDGPCPKAVELVAHKFQGASFDGMQDLKSYHDSDFNGERVHFSADYVFVSQRISAATKQKVEAALASLNEIEMNNLQAAMSVGKFGAYSRGVELTPQDSDWPMFVRKVFNSLPK